MIIALPYKQGILQEIDHSEIVALYHIENNQVIGRQLVQPDTTGEGLIEYLYRARVNQVILPSLNDDIKFELDYYQMGYVSGVRGETDEIVERFLEGAFEDDD
ncbi:MAG TPA: hypothetical protein GXZ74_08005 [Tissierellia bacterium]|nr:hypothetical protein [Tissierellia bacterium]